jgi:hypothetical protein
VLEQFVRLPEFLLVSMIMLIGSVLPNWCLGVTLFYYFRCLFVTHDNYSGESQQKLAYQDFTLARLQCQYAITPLRHYAIMPLRHYAITPVRQYTSMPVRQYASTPVRQLYKPQQLLPSQHVCSDLLGRLCHPMVFNDDDSVVISHHNHHFEVLSIYIPYLIILATFSVAPPWPIIKRAEYLKYTLQHPCTSKIITKG